MFPFNTHQNHHQPLYYQNHQLPNHQILNHQISNHRGHNGDYWRGREQFNHYDNYYSRGWSNPNPPFLAPMEFQLPIMQMPLPKPTRTMNNSHNNGGTAGNAIYSGNGDRSSSSGGMEDVQDEGGVLIYIDNSNIWINTMEMSAKLLKFRNDIKQDQRTRVNINKVLSIASAGRPIIRAVLYGSEPPPVAKFWNNVKENKFCKFDVQVTRRSTYSNKEREVDQNIMLDIGVDIVIHQNHAKHGGTVILFTGDGGMISAVRRALKYGWNVEIWAYRSSLAKDYQEEAQKDEKFTLKYMDDVFQEIVFYTLEWKSPIPRERSFVITFRRLPNEKKAEVLEACVKAFTEIVRMPMAGRYLKDNDGDRSIQTHLSIVCSVGKLILKEDSRSDAQNKSETDHNLNNNHNHNQHTSNSNKNGTSTNQNTFRFSIEQWDKVPEILGLEFLKEELTFNTRVKPGIENLIQEALKTNSNFLDNPKYDFNADVYLKVENALCLEKLSSINSTDIGQNLKEDLENIIRRYKPEMRSLLLFLQDMRLEDYPDIESQLESPANEDDGEGGYTVHTGRKARRKFQKYSQECKYSFRCVNGFKCTYNHSDKEKEFFKLQTDSKLRKTYKFKPCDHFQTQTCKYKRSMSYMCPFAHGYFCFVCKCDEDGGHNPLTCSAPPKPTSGSDTDQELYHNGDY